MAVWLLGGMTVYTDNKDFSINAASKSLTEGNEYYSLADVLEDFVTQSGIDIEWSITTAGLVKFTRITQTNWTCTWDDSQLRDYLGFTGNLSGAITYTAANPPAYSFFPKAIPEGIETFFNRRAQSILSLSDTLTPQWTVDTTAVLKDGMLTVRIDEDGTEGNSRTQWQSFIKHAKRGIPFACYPDSSNLDAWATDNRTGFIVLTYYESEMQYSVISDPVFLELESTIPLWETDTTGYTTAIAAVGGEEILMS